MQPITIVDAGDVEAALLHEALVPPPPPDTMGAGPTADLRSAMARFSSGESHGTRRLEVEQAIAAIGKRRLIADARQRTTAILSVTSPARIVDAIADIGLVVPVNTVAAALGVPDTDLDEVRRDVYSIVAVIGRREPSNPVSDAAATRLLNRLGGLDRDGVAAVSMLYQSHDASAALFAATLLADQSGQRRRPALAATSRIATEDVTIGQHRIQRGTTITVDLEPSSFEFGMGIHGCPGREIAERIAAGMIDAVRHSDLEVNIAKIEWLPDQRPSTLPLRVKADLSEARQS